MVGDIEKKLDFVSTGSWVINRLIGDGSLQDKPGGIPRGYVTEVYGDEGTGKTTFGLHVAQQALAAGERVVYADFEHSLRAQRKYVENLGIELNPMRFLHLTPTSFEDGVKVIGQALIKMKPAVVIIDSVTSMIPKSFAEKDADDTVQIGLHAKLMGQFLNWITKKLGKYNTALLLVNQKRSNIKASKYDPGPNEVTSGGKAVRFFTTLRIHLKSTSEKETVAYKSDITGISEQKAVSQVVKVVIEKNKLDMPYKSGPVHIEFGQGIDNIMSLVSLGINKKIIKKGSAGWYSWADPNGDLDFNIQGKTKVKKHLEDNPDVLEAMKPYLMPTTDVSEVDTLLGELEGKGIENLTPDELEQLKELREIKGLPIDDLEFTADEMEELAELDAIAGGETEK